jgi:hypothetical protein
MRVIFEDEKAKGLLIANMKNLATAEDKSKQLSITHDMRRKGYKIEKDLQKIRIKLMYWRKITSR